jgi:hypothetical protein
MRSLRQAADARVADSRAERAASRGTVTDHLVAPALFPAMPPEVIQMDIKNDYLAGAPLQRRRAGVRSAKRSPEVLQ